MRKEKLKKKGRRDFRGVQLLKCVVCRHTISLWKGRIIVTESTLYFIHPLLLLLLLLLSLSIYLSLYLSIFSIPVLPLPSLFSPISLSLLHYNSIQTPTTPAFTTSPGHSLSICLSLLFTISLSIYLILSLSHQILFYHGFILNTSHTVGINIYTYFIK